MPMRWVAAAARPARGAAGGSAGHWGRAPWLTLRVTRERPGARLKPPSRRNGDRPVTGSAPCARRVLACQPLGSSTRAPASPLSRPHEEHASGNHRRRVRLRRVGARDYALRERQLRRRALRRQRLRRRPRAGELQRPRLVGDRAQRLVATVRRFLLPRQLHHAAAGPVSVARLDGHERRRLIHPRGGLERRRRMARRRQPWRQPGRRLERRRLAGAVLLAGPHRPVLHGERGDAELRRHRLQ